MRLFVYLSSLIAFCLSFLINDFYLRLHRPFYKWFLLPPLALYFSIPFIKFYCSFHSTYLILFYEITFNDVTLEDPEYFSQTVDLDKGATEKVVISDKTIYSSEVDNPLVVKTSGNITTSSTNINCITEVRGLGDMITQTKDLEENIDNLGDEDESGDTMEMIWEKITMAKIGAIEKCDTSFEGMMIEHNDQTDKKIRNEEKRGYQSEDKINKFREWRDDIKRLDSFYDETYAWRQGGLRRGVSPSLVELNYRFEEFIKKGKRHRS